MGAGALSPVARRAVRVAAALALACALLPPARVAAQADPSGRWTTLETAHFRVHVRPDQDSLGVRVAGEAEAAWAALAARLPAPRRKVDLVVDDHLDVANGVTTVFPSPRVVIYPVPPTADVELQSYDRWLRILVTHELTHVFHLDLARGWWRLGRSVLGRAPFLFPNAYLPTWLLEGLAVHYESVLSGAGRDAGSFHPEVVGAQAAERGGLGIDAANSTSPIWPGGYRPYAFGAEFLGGIADREGEAAMDRLAVRTASAALPYIELDRSFRLATGVSASKRWREWQAGLPGIGGRKAAGPGGAEPADTAPPHRADGIAPPHRAPTGGLRQLVAPRVSADGRRILFVLADGVDAARIAVLDRPTGAVRTLARFNDGPGVAWDSGGTGAGVIASEYDFTDPYTLRADLVRVDAGGRERRLTRGARLLAPDVTRDGAVVAVRTDAGSLELVRWAAGALTVLVPPAPLVEWAQPRVSPDGRLMAATRAEGGALDIVLLAADGRVIRQVTRDRAVDQMPAFSPDGAWLFWSSDRSGRPQVYAARTADPDAAWWRVTDEPYGAYAPAPASDSVFCLAYHADGYRLAAVPFDTAAWVRVPVERGGAASAARDSAAASDTVPRTPVLARHAYHPWPAFLPQYWLPIGAVQGSAGWFGIYTSGLDALGRHAYGFDALVGTGLAAGTWRADVSYAYAGLRRVVLDASFSRAEDSYFLRPPPPASGVVRGCCARDDQAEAGVTAPLRRYRTAAALRVAGEYEHSWGRERAGTVVSVAAARVVAPAFAVSAQSGWRVSGFVRRRWRLDGSGGAGYAEEVGRASLYLPLPRLGFARQVLAVHAAAGWLSGTDTVFFGAGGVSGSAVPLLPGISAGSTTRDFPVRGYQPADAFGRGAAAATLEWRVPLALVGRGLGLVPGVLDRLSLAAFADGGVAWSPAAWTARFPGLPARTTLLSAGAEAAVDLGVFYDYPVRLRAGAAERLRGRRGVSGYVTVGAAF